MVVTRNLGNSKDDIVVLNPIFVSVAICNIFAFNKIIKEFIILKTSFNFEINGFFKNFHKFNTISSHGSLYLSFAWFISFVKTENIQTNFINLFICLRRTYLITIFIKYLNTMCIVIQKAFKTFIIIFRL